MKPRPAPGTLAKRVRVRADRALPACHSRRARQRLGQSLQAAANPSRGSERNPAHITNYVALSTRHRRLSILSGASQTTRGPCRPAHRRDRRRSVRPGSCSCLCSRSWTLIELDTCDAPLQKLLTHHIARSEQAILYSAQGQAGHFHNLFVSQILRVTQNDQLAIGSRQRPHDAFNLEPPFLTLALLFRTDPSAFDCQFIGFAFGADD